MKKTTPKTIATFDTPLRNSLSPADAAPAAVAGLLIALALALAWLALMPTAQATNLSPTCQKIDDVIKGLEQKKQDLGDQLKQEGPALKPILKEQIDELNEKIQAKKIELQKCIEEHPYVPPETPKPPLKECAALKKEIEKLRTALSNEVRAAVAHLQEQLHDAPDKAQIIEQIKVKTADIKKNSPTAKKLADKIEAYNRCMVTGPYVKELSGLDNLMVNWMNKYGFRAATLAVLKDKKLVYERGYGYQDENLTTPILHNARMRLASVSLVLTKRALRQLIEDKLLDPEAFVYQIMNLPPWVGTYADERMKAIKIQHLLDDTSCFADGAITAAAGTSENPQKVIGKAMALGRNATLAESLKFIWSASSTMLPSSSCTVGKGKWDDATSKWLPQGSHFAMEVAAQIIAKTYAESSNQILKDNDPTVVGKKYGEYIKLKVGAPIEASFFQANNTPTEAWPKEIWYKSLFKTDPEWNRKWLPLPQVSAAYGIDFFARPGSGTVVAAGRDFARYLKNYWLNGSPKPANLAGMPSYSRADGSLPGTSAITVDQVWSTGVSRSFVVLVNMRNETITPDTSHNEITSSIESYLNGVTTWPTIDLF
jgi:hypothetical protein